ncbi:Asp-tRNA(Asn)/Glu-tRNA(Gln) amidotransferase subunit GatB [Ornithinimicrobium sufpigmenti]|uniref:Asp-tRNA(Asn)/Glu-tRNA(Gln) amidotransferase subunit GatB n=1 Tax=Ornithinimicrobium sufpigmenti TaxID=2508882 RepID=UPI0010360A3C|nr:MULTISPECIES: Asp-tRNA(Asn)/Glu-tRNA(Gln) amidotransferase subunit GatB [unclassified Ornithinimicrobium]
MTLSTRPVHQEDTVPYEQALERYEPVTGLEVHVELSTATKMFCGCATGFGAEPNTQTCPVCLGLPGALPVVNAAAVESAIRIGLALNCSIAEWCRFARKNYFYPDMPKNFQTSQYDEPIAFDGWLDVEVPANEKGEPAFTFRVEIERAHMEEDTGKSTHIQADGRSSRIHGADYSVVDYNRAGIPLIEIVTKPMLGAGDRAPEVARAYVAALRDLLLALDVTHGRMEQGNIRCDANVSLMPVGSEVLGTRTETKNVNSLRSVERAVRYEITRHAAILDAGEEVFQETRHWHEDTGITTAGRPKSDADDYRYFPEPDLVPVAPSREDVERLGATLPEPPAERRRRLQAAWGFSDLEMRDVVNAGAIEVIQDTVAAGSTPAAARKWWSGELARRANADGVAVTDLGVTPADIAELDSLVGAGRLNDSMARQVLEGVVAGEGTPTEVADARGLELVQDDSALQAAVDTVLEANPDVVERIRGGKVQAVGALIGQVMKQMRGQADAARARELILATLEVEG